MQSNTTTTIKTENSAIQAAYVNNGRIHKTATAISKRTDRSDLTPDDLSDIFKYIFGLRAKLPSCAPRHIRKEENIRLYNITGKPVLTLDQVNEYEQALLDGHTYQYAARLIGYHPGSVRRWIRAAQKGEGTLPQIELANRVSRIREQKLQQKADSSTDVEVSSESTATQ